MIRYDIFINCNWVVTRWQYTFTHRKTQITTNLEECGPFPVFGSLTLAFALQLRKKQQNDVHIFLVSNVCHMLCPSPSPRFHRPNKIWGDVQVMKFCITLIPLHSSYIFVPLRSKYILSSSTQWFRTCAVYVFLLIWRIKAHTLKKNHQQIVVFYISVLMGLNITRKYEIP